MKKHLLDKLPAKVSFHLDHGYTRIQFLQPPHNGWDIPTSAIPSHLRKIGTPIKISASALWPENNDSPEQLRDAQWILVEDASEPT